MSDVDSPISSPAPTMARIGLIGGVSWQSSLRYYRLVNEQVQRRLGGLHSADCVMRSLDGATVNRLQREGRFDELAALLAAEARGLAEAGAGVIVLCTGTLHRVADVVAAGLDVPLLHIADAVGDAAEAAGLRTLGLLGTADVTEQGFYLDRLRCRHGPRVLIPDGDDRRIVHEVIGELCRGELHARSRHECRRIIGELAGRGADAIILGCTELGRVVTGDHAPVPLLDATVLHAEAAVMLALKLAPAPAQWERDGYVISADRSRLDREAIWRFLRTSYWSPGIARATVERNIENSLAFGLYTPAGATVGFARLVTDTSSFAWLADVFVLPDHRGRGLGEWLVGTVLSHPAVARLRVTLATRDAHGLYERYGFRPVDPGRFMERRAPRRPPDDTQPSS